MIVVNCVKEGDTEYLQLGYDHARGMYYAQVKDKENNRVVFFTWLGEYNSVEEAEEAAKRIMVK